MLGHIAEESTLPHRGLYSQIRRHWSCAGSERKEVMVRKSNRRNP